MPSYHQGEIAVQELVGVRAEGARLEGLIADHVPERVRDFLETVDAAATAARSPDGRVWASLWLGLPGFLASSSDGDCLVVKRQLQRPSPDDPVDAHGRPGDPFGMLAIDFFTRRRFRINGTIAGSTDEALAVTVHEAFVNCPKYIQRRVPVTAEASPPAARATHGAALDDERIALVARADTAFIATGHPHHGLDVSHRGGVPGFIRAADARTLVLPDYRGNNMFTTFGNLAVSPRAGLAVVDFEARRILSITGEAHVSYGDAPGMDGAERVCRFTVASWVELAMPGPTRWLLLDRSPFNPPLTDEPFEAAG